MKRPFQTQCRSIALAYPVKACLVVLALLPGAVGCATVRAPQTPGLAQGDAAGAETRPLTPEEWVRRNFPNTASETAVPPSEFKPPTPAVMPVPQASPPARPAATPPVLVARTISPETLPASPPRPRVRPTDAVAKPVPQASPPARPAATPPVLVARTSSPETLPASPPRPRVRPTDAVAKPVPQASPQARPAASRPVLVAQASVPTQPAVSTPAVAAQTSPPTQPAASAPAMLAQASPPESLPATPAAPQLEPAKPAAAPTAPQDAQPNKPEGILLREGDMVRVSFPGAPTLNTAQQIRRDGSITLQMVGEFKIAGLTTIEAEKELIKLYGRYLQVKEVTVALESSTFSVYVTGAVLRPGKITSDRPLSAMEAVVEAGIDYSKANLKRVRIVRTEKGRSEYHILNLRDPLFGKAGVPFDLKPSDIIYVPERFTWF